MRNLYEFWSKSKVFFVTLYHRMFFFYIFAVFFQGNEQNKRCLRAK